MTGTDRYLLSHLRSCRKVQAVFNRAHGYWETVGHTWVWEVKRDHPEEIQQMRRERKRQKPFFIPVGHTWAQDLTLIRSPFGFTFTVLAILDAGSRKLLTLKVLPGKRAHTLLAHLHLAFAEHGLPVAIRTDNEAMFTSAMWRMTLKALKALGTMHRRGPPYQPWHNGRLERFWGTLKQALCQLRLETVTALQTTLDKFVRFYNSVRPHQALAGLTPQEVWQGKTMAEVQLAHAQGLCHAAVHLLVGFHVRC